MKVKYSRNQFEPLPEPLLAINQVNKDTEIPLRTAANKQSQGGGQGLSNVTVTEPARLTIANVRRITNFVTPGVKKRVKCF